MVCFTAENENKKSFTYKTATLKLDYKLPVGCLHLLIKIHPCQK